MTKLVKRQTNSNWGELFGGPGQPFSDTQGVGTFFRCAIAFAQHLARVERAGLTIDRGHRRCRPSGKGSSAEWKRTSPSCPSWIAGSVFTFRCGGCQWRDAVGARTPI